MGNNPNSDSPIFLKSRSRMFGLCLVATSLLLGGFPGTAAVAHAADQGQPTKQTAQESPGKSPRATPGKTPPARFQEGRKLYKPSKPAADPAEKKPAPSDAGQTPGTAPDDGKRLDQPSALDDASDGSTNSKGWTVVLASFSGPEAVEAARQSLEQVSKESGRRDVSIRRTPRGAALVVGSFAAPEAPEAGRTLAEMRAREVGGTRPFASAFLAPPVETLDAGELPELNLANAKRSFGARAKYTLQIGVYEAANRQEAKRAAEKAALVLRQQGEMAFYYHGDSLSMVTVGVFGDADFDKDFRPKSPALGALRQRYPLNLLNGQFPIVERWPGGGERQQQSMLVEVP